MKRLLAAIAATVSVLAFALPAHADPPNNDAIIGAGGCTATITINNDAGGPFDPPGESGSTISPENNSCAFQGIKTRILKCDGTTSTSSEDSQFNPPAFASNGHTFFFSCASAGIIGVYVRTDSDSGVWNPSSGYIYYSVGPPESCSPSYCIL